MCVVSAVHAAYQKFPRTWWTVPRYNEYQDIVERLNRIDEALGLKDCGHEAKEKLMKELADELGFTTKKRVEKKRWTEESGRRFITLGRGVRVYPIRLASLVGGTSDA